MMSSISNLKLGALQTNGKAKAIPILSAQGKPDVTLNPGYLQVPFNASAYQNSEASRLNLCFSVTDELRSIIQTLDNEVKKLVKPRLGEIFGAQAASIEKQDEWYHSPLKVSSMGYETLRCKLNIGGKNSVRVWDHQKEQMDIPTDWTIYQVKPRIWIRGVYILGKELGCILDITDAQLEPVKYTCPF